MSEPTPEAAPAADAAGAAPAAPKASKLPIILAAVNFLAILGLGGYFVYTQQHAAAQPKHTEEKSDEKKEGHGEEKAAAHGEEEEASDEEEEEPAPAHGEKKAEGHGEKKAEGHGEKKAEGHGGGHAEEAAGEGPAGPLLALESMVTNLAGEDSDRYLKVSMQVRLSSEAARSEVEGQLVPVRNQILLYLSSLTVDETSGAENKRDIQKKVKRIANEAMMTSRITAVYFTEFVIQ